MPSWEEKWPPALRPGEAPDKFARLCTLLRLRGFDVWRAYNDIGVLKDGREVGRVMVYDADALETVCYDLGVLHD